MTIRLFYASHAGIYWISACAPDDINGINKYFQAMWATPNKFRIDIERSGNEY